MNPDVDKEIEAIKIVLAALQPLAPEVRVVVMEYVFKRLGMKAHELEDDHPARDDHPTTLPPHTEQIQTSSVTTTPVHLKTLKEQKQPKSAIEMAVLVAYYLSHVLTEPERKDTVSAKDLDTYFKIAEFKLPAHQKFNLINARNAGYLDLAGPGEYKLNPVGYNLVVHSMPRAGKSSTTTRRSSKASTKSSKASTKKKAGANTTNSTPGKKNPQKAT